MTPGTGAGGRSCCRSPDIATGWRIFPEAGTPGDLLHKSGQAEVLGRVHSSGLGIPHNRFLYNKLEHILHSRSARGMGLHTAHRKPQTAMEPGFEHM